VIGGGWRRTRPVYFPGDGRRGPVLGRCFKRGRSSTCRAKAKTCSLGRARAAFARGTSGPEKLEDDAHMLLAYGSAAATSTYGVDRKAAFPGRARDRRRWEGPDPQICREIMDFASGEGDVEFRARRPQHRGPSRVIGPLIGTARRDLQMIPRARGDETRAGRIRLRSGCVAGDAILIMAM